LTISVQDWRKPLADTPACAHRVRTGWPRARWGYSVRIPDTPSMTRHRSLPADADRVLELAARSMFDVFAQTAQGMLVVDREHRIVWISEGYKRFLPALGHAESDFVGRRVEDVVPNTMIPQVIETGRPILVDLLTNQAGTFLVSRLPLRDDAGQVIGALGLVLMDHPESTMQPLMTKFARLQGELDDARKALAEQRRPKYTITSFIGASPAAAEVKRQARRVAATDATVLLLGETGTGKELLAHAIHAAGARAARPFIGINVSALPETLMEAEFFGVAPGAYTGADRKGRDGKFRIADGGTLFLDEIGDMPLPLQTKLLRVLQEQEVEPLGSNTVHKVDVRVIAATSRDLPAMVADGRFRADLYYRLHVVPIRLPPLRDRIADLESLADTLLEDIARRSGLVVRSLSAEALATLALQPWPGNIRELRNVLEQAALMTDDLVLAPAHLPFGDAQPGPGSLLRTSTGTGAQPLHDQVADLERRAIRDALAATGGNRVATARLLKISRAALYDKLARWPDLASP